MKRARHNLLKRFLLTIWMVVGIIFSINAQYPDNFDISQDLKFDYDECTGRLTIDFRVYYYGGVDDYMKNASVYANIPGQGNTEILYYSGSSNYNNHCWYQRGGYNFNITTNCSGAWYSSGPGDSRWVKVEWLDYPQSILDAGQFDMVFDYSWDGNYDDFNNDGNTKTVNITRPDVPTGLTATTNDCNNVILNWDESSFTCASQSSFSPYYQIRRKVQGSAGLSSSLSYIPHGTTTYTDTGASSGTTYEYSIRFERDYTNGVNTSLFSNESSPVIGKRKETPPIPLNLMASDDNCDGTIDLTWDVPFGTNADGYVISYAGNTSGTINAVGGNTSSTVHSGVLNDNVYTYTIAAMNDCGSSSASASETGISLGSPISVTLSTPIVDPVNQTVQLDWNDVVNELEYKVVRTFAGGGGMVQTNVGQNITTFTDTDVNPCIEYRYQVFTLNSCSSTGAVSNNTMNVTLPIDLTQVFDNTKKLDASKGYYPDRVELTWDNNQGQDLSSFRISRKASGSTSAYALIATVNPSSAIYIDNSISANIIYDYKIEGATQCDDGVVLSNASLAKGFRSPAGIISGQITYSGGVAVEGVRVLVESTDNAGNYGGSSVYLAGLSDELTIPHSSTLDQSMGFTMEMWIKPSNWANDFTLIKKIDNNDGLIVEKIGSNVIVKMGDGSGFTDVISIPVSEFSPNQFDHFAIVYDTNNAEFYINGNEVATGAFGGFVAATGDMIIGEGNYDGYIDEIRFWNEAREAVDIAQDHGRLLNGTETGLTGYWKLDAGITGLMEFYDVSRTGAIYNQNHGTLSGAWAEELPTSEQLGYSAYTDATGNYIVNGIKYSEAGQTFNVVPAFGTHSFSPTNTILYVGDGSFVHGNVDFTDNSSFTVNGRAIYHNTSCFVEDVNVLIDGTPVVLNGQVIRTDANGEFSIQVPIGNHYISLEKQGHVFSEGRFPATGNFNFQDNIFSHIQFVDSTLLKVVGRVVGGSQQGGKTAGLGRSVNNIGQAHLNFSSMNGCVDYPVDTDPATGEYVAYLPPLRYAVDTVVIPSNLAIGFGTIKLVDLRVVPPVTEVVDTLFFPGTSVVQSIDSTSFYMQHDYVYRVAPQLDVYADEGNTPFMGDAELDYLDPNGDEQIIDLNTTAFDFPVLHQRRKYKAYIRASELYQNFDIDPTNPAEDKVSVIDGEMIINNQLAAQVSENIGFTEQDSGLVVYEFLGGFPNTNLNNTTPEYSFTKPINITLLTTGNSVEWQPYAANSAPGGGGDKYFRAYLFGSEPTGTAFVTKGPSKVELVLRDPPGSSSQATWSSGNTITKSESYGLNTSSSLSLSNKVSLGANTWLLTGPTITGAEAENNIELGLEVGLSFEDETEVTTTISSSTSISTPGIDTDVGPGGDVFFGRAFNIVFGKTFNVELIESSLCGNPNVECHGPVINGHRIGKISGRFISPQNTETRFAYTRNDIELYVIPGLIELRNALFVNLPGIYTNNVTNTADPIYARKFASNNDDPLWGTPNNPANSPLRHELDLDSDGQSYTFSETPTHDTDSIRFYNNQIRLWKLAIAYNEQEKYHAFNNGTAAQNLSFGGTVAIDNETSSSRETSKTSSWEVSMSRSASTEVGFTVSGVGSVYSAGLTVENKESKSTNATLESETVLAYHFEDGNVGDFFNVESYKDEGGGGDMFKVIGGKSSCPWEPGEKTKYFDPSVMPSTGSLDTFIYSSSDLTVLNNQHILSPPTLQREKPTISATPNVLYNIPADETAQFTLTLGNESESEDQMVYTVAVDQASNPFGAQVTLDGEPEISVTIPPNSTVTKTLTVASGNVAFEHENLNILIYSQCQFYGGTDNTVDIVDTATVSVYFVPTCTEPEFIQPSDQFVLNNSFNDTLPVVVSGYNYNYNGFDNVKFQFKESSSPNWVQMETFHKDTTGLGTNAVPIPTTQSYVTYDFDVSDLPDGEYDIRTQSACNYPNTPEVNVNSSILSGILDRVNPSTFGTPSPGDGILSPNDNIEIQFNEPINGAILNAVDNFDIRGVVNGTTLLRSASLFFDGADDYVELAPGLNLTTHSMTIEFWAKRSSLGEQVVFSQGTDPQQTLIAGFDANDRFNFQVGSSTVVADVPMTDLTQWHHYAVSFDYENDEVGLFQDDVLVNVSNLAFSSNYLGSGRTLFGEASSGNKRSFNGYLSEMRIWDEARTLAEVLTFQNISLTGREPHLVSNWSMDEVEGNIVKDHVRQRNGTINNATWNVSPSGNSAGFNGSNFVSIPTADIPITEEMDFTLDFWFKGTGTDMTMFSNGRADTGDETEWAVRFDAEGDLVITHEGADHEIYEEELLEDNTWYHLSVVLRRVSTLSVYMDGNLHRTLSSSLFKGMASPFMFLGARSGNILPSPQTDEYYTGIIGDFSLWNTARAQLQLERDSRNRLQGNEYGLLSYLPFESYQLMNNVPVLTPTFDDQARPGTVVTTTGSPTLPTETPLIKLQRPVESIPFTFSVNNDKINITPTLDPAILENTTIDITVRKVEDMNGNVQQSPATWIAYFDKNQVVWQDMNLNFEKLLNEELSFTSNIVNTGGSAENFNLENLPSWLSATPTSGTIAPNSTLQVQFEVDPNMSIGEYEDDVDLTTSFNFAEKLNLDLKVYKTPPAWEVNPADYDYSMNIIGVVKINNVESTEEEDLLVAFIDGEVRGVANLEYFPDFDRHFVFLDIYDNIAQGDSIKFKVWNAREGKIHDDVQPTLVFNSDQVIGTPTSPQIFLADNKLEFEYVENAGWNWISFNLLTPDSTNLNNLLDELEAYPEDILKAQNNFADYNANYGWVGSLNGTQAGIKVEKSYRLYLAEGDTFTIDGYEINTEVRPVPVSIGWNWIGYLPQKNISINTALGNYNATPGDIMKGQTEFAVYDDVLGWVGSLESLKPGKGYMMSAAANGEIIYPRSTTDKGPGEGEDLTENEYWSVEKGAYPSNMTVIANLNYCEELITSDNFLLGAFLGKECRGLAIPSTLPETDGNVFYMTISGVDNEQIDYRLLNVETGEEISLMITETFASDTHKGSLEKPRLLTMPSSYDCKTIAEEESETLDDLNISVTPQLFQTQLSIRLDGEITEQELSVSMTDNLGRLVMQPKTFESSNEIIIKDGIENLPNGAYFLTVRLGDSVKTFKLIKIRA